MQKSMNSCMDPEFSLLALCNITSFNYKITLHFFSRGPLPDFLQMIVTRSRAWCILSVFYTSVQTSFICCVTLKCCTE